jgi:hypothetical protein
VKATTSAEAERKRLALGYVVDVRRSRVTHGLHDDQADRIGRRLAGPTSREGLASLGEGELVAADVPVSSQRLDH